jgi:H+-transporting ATPase
LHTVPRRLLDKPLIETPASATDDRSRGLSSDEAARRLLSIGANAMPDPAVHPWRMALTKLWSPVPWMLEAAALLELVMRSYVEAAIIAGLLLFNATLGLFQENRAQDTLTALRSRLAMNATVKRDGAWKTVPAVELVPGDVVRLSLGSVVAADIRLTSGNVLIDQSMLTGESVPLEALTGMDAYAGALVRRGEAIGDVTATGTRTKFGRTAELVATAHVTGTEQKTVVQIVRNLSVFNGFVIIVLVGYARTLGMPFRAIIPLLLVAVLASIPVALPATFTLAAALGARALAKLNVLPTRLSAVDEAATVDVLCVDKTGTLTCNQLSVTQTVPLAGFDQAHVLMLAAMASSEGGQDPVDEAVRNAAAAQKTSDTPRLLGFVPFDPATRMSQASAIDKAGQPMRIVKGAFAVVSAIAGSSPAALSAAGALQAQGFRVLAVAAGAPTSMGLIGLIALSDPPRADSAALITQLHDLGVRVVMITGDAAATAAIVAKAVKLDGAIYPPGPIQAHVDPMQFVVFAGVLPEDKYQLVKAFQNSGHTVGMCGDGANDAPALRQAQMGIAVSSATDVAKAAAGMVLTKPGLAGIVAAVKEGRITFQRILTYTMNSVIKKIVSVLFLIFGLVVTGQAILTPLLMVIIMITGDFLAMSLTTDNVRASPAPNRWQIGHLTGAGIALGSALLIFDASMIAIGKYALHMGIDELRSLCFIVLVFGGQGTLYAIRDRRRLWGSRPSNWLIASSLADLLIAGTLAARGLAMTRLPIVVVLGTLIASLAFSILLGLLKLPIFRRFDII